MPIQGLYLPVQQLRAFHRQLGNITSSNPPPVAEKILSGHNGVIWAIANKHCRLAWKILHDDVSYIEQGSETTQAKKRRVQKPVRTLRILGYLVALTPINPGADTAAPGMMIFNRAVEPPMAAQGDKTAAQVLDSRRERKGRRFCHGPEIEAARSSIVATSAGIHAGGPAIRCSTQGTRMNAPSSELPHIVPLLLMPDIYVYGKPSVGESNTVMTPAAFRVKPWLYWPASRKVPATVPAELIAAGAV